MSATRDVLFFGAMTFILGCMITFLGMYWVQQAMSEEPIAELSDEFPITLEYHNLTPEQIKNVESILSKVDLKYMHGIKSILILPDIQSYCINNPDRPTCSRGKDGGVNGIYQSGHILVKYRSDLVAVKETVCHELLHAHIKRDWKGDVDEPKHEIVEDAGEKGVCYR